jgi:hypothetical protein
MLSFLISLAIMFSLVWAGITWAKREERRRMQFHASEEVPRARDHR